MKASLDSSFRSFDIFVFTICSTVGLGVGVLPYAGEEELRNEWLQLLVGSGPYFLLLWLIYLFYKKRNNIDFFDEIKSFMPKWIVWGIFLYFIGSTLYAGVIQFSGMNQIIEIYLLPNTPKWIILLSFLATVCLAVYYDIKAITRFLVTLFFIECLFIISLFVLGFSDYFRWIYIPPIHEGNMIDFFKASISDLARFGGVFTLLAFLSYVKKGERTFASMGLGLGFVTLLYVTLSIIVLGTFGYDESLSLISPLIVLTQTFLPGHGVFERLDLLYLMFWIVVFFKMVIIHVWFIVHITLKLLPQVNRLLITVFYLGFMLVLTITTAGYSHTGWGFHNYNTLAYTLVLPTILLLILNNRKVKS